MKDNGLIRIRNNLMLVYTNCHTSLEPVWFWIKAIGVYKVYILIFHSVLKQSSLNICTNHKYHF